MSGTPRFSNVLISLRFALGISLNQLVDAYLMQSRYAEAEPLHKRSLAIREKALGADHRDVGVSLSNLASLYQAQGSFAEAEPFYKRVVSIFEKALGPDHPTVAFALNNVGFLAVAQENLACAASAWRQATAILQRRTVRGTADGSGGSAKAEAERLSWYFYGLIKSIYRLAAEVTGALTHWGIEMFETAQWGQGSEVAASLAQMASRSASGSPELAALMRKRQDLVAEWRGKDKLLVAAKSEPPAKRDSSLEKALSELLAIIDTRLAEIDARFTKDFPDYAALASPKPISMDDVQADLREDEALVLFLDTDAQFKPLPEETFAWVVTKREVRWVRSEIGTQALTDEVAALRCGLDADAWDDEGAAERCRGLVTGEPLRDIEGNVLSETLPFDTARAHRLYKALLGEVEDLIRGKHLLIVLSGALTQLPPQVLLTAEPNDLAHAAWLTKGHALTVLPAVSSLKALRRVGKASSATLLMIGIGNPLLDGNPRGHPWEDTNINYLIPIDVIFAPARWWRRRSARDLNRA